MYNKCYCNYSRNVFVRNTLCNLRVYLIHSPRSLFQQARMLTIFCWSHSNAKVHSDVLNVKHILTPLYLHEFKHWRNSETGIIYISRGKTRSLPLSPGLYLSYVQKTLQRGQKESKHVLYSQIVITNCLPIIKL